MLQTAAAEAVRRAMKGEFEPFTLPKPYRVEFTLRRTFPDSVVAGVSALKEFSLERTGERSFRPVTDSAREMGYPLDAIEAVVPRH
jgi:hypothetical protein